MTDSLSINTQEAPVLEVIEYHQQTSWAEYDITKKVFYLEYAKDYDVANAALCAGISTKEGRQWLREPIGSAFLSDLLENSRISTNITEDFIASNWVALLPKLMGEEEVNLVLPSGDSIMAKKFDGASTISALKEMGKATKFYEDGSGQGASLNLSVFMNQTITKESAAEEYMKVVRGEQ